MPVRRWALFAVDRLHPRHGANFRIFDVLDFIAEVVAHIPNTHEKSVIYYGWYSNKARGMRSTAAPHPAGVTYSA